MKKRLKICLAWHNLDSENYGVSALAIAHTALILKAAKNHGISVSLTTFGTSGSDDLKIRAELEDRYKIKINHIDFSIKKEIKNILTGKQTSLSKLKSFDLILDQGEGDSFTDIYGHKRFITLSITKAYAIFKSIGLVLSPQTIGPYKSRYSAFIARWLMKRAESVFTRDQLSGVVLKRMGITPIETTDVAFSLPYDKNIKRKNHVGLNVSALLWNGGYNKNNQFNLTLDYQDLTKQIIDGLLSRGQYVHLVAHVISENNPIEDDYSVCKTIKSYYNDNEKLILAPSFRSPIEAKSYMSQFEFFAGARMHATIGAVSSGVPTIPIAYSRKFAGVFEGIGYKYTIEAYEADIEEFIRIFFRYFDEEKDLMSKKVEEARERANIQNSEYVRYLEGILSNAKS